MQAVMLLAFAVSTIRIGLSQENELTCNLPESPKYGRLQLLSGHTRVDAIVLYLCDDNRKLIGSRMSKCSTSGTWTTPTPECIEICRVPDVSHGYIGFYTRMNEDMFQEFRRMEVGSQINENYEIYLRCNNSHTALNTTRNEEIIRCKNGTWENTPECTEGCESKPPSVPNARIVRVNRWQGGTVFYRCFQGFRKVKRGEVICNHGVWKGRPAVCKDTKCYAKDLQNNIGLDLTSSNVTNHREYLDVVCKDGYKVNESSSLFCVQGKWMNNDESPCEERSCRSVHFDNGELVVRMIRRFFFSNESVESFRRVNLNVTYDVGEFLYLKCDRGFTPEGNGFTNEFPLSCRRGIWTPHVECLRRSCVIPSNAPVFNGKRFYKSGENFEPVCLKGFRLASPGKRLICNDGEWEHAPISLCVPADCAEAPVLEHAKVVNFTLQHDSLAIYECDQFYTRGKYSEIRCAYGRWVGSTTPCRATKCFFSDINYPGILPVKSMFNEGESFAPSCGDGYKITSEEIRFTCIYGKWTALQLPPCEPALCSFSDINFPGLVPVKSDFNSSESFAPSCEKGYKLANTENVFTCTNGEWKALHLPPCKPEDCTDPPTLKHGKVKTFTVSHGSQATFECDPFYRMEGTSKLQCVFGKWEGQMPLCIAGTDTCKPIIKPANSPLVIEPVQEFYQFGESVNFYCPFGQKLTPQIESLLCLNGWLGLVVPECVII